MEKLELFLLKNNISFEKKFKVENSIFDYYLIDAKIAINSISFNEDVDRKLNINNVILCQNHNIKLIHIFEDEYINKFDIIINRLTNLIGLTPNKIFARKTTIAKIDKKTKDSFLKQYHIQGADVSAYYYGLYCNDELLSIITFKNTKENGVYEMNRFVTKFGYNVVGGFTKLLQYFIKSFNPKTIITFADIKWTPNVTESVYKKMGFELIEIQPPVYHYVKDGVRKNRQQFMKHKILERNPELSAELTELELTKILGYKRVYDCGNYKFILNIENYKEIVKTAIIKNVVKKTNLGKKYILNNTVKNEVLDEQVLELINQGKNKKEISEIIGIYEIAIGKSFDRLGIQKKHSDLKQEYKDIAIKMYKDGKGLKLITKEINLICKPNITKHKVRQFLEKVGLKIKEV